MSEFVMWVVAMVHSFFSIFTGPVPASPVAAFDNPTSLYYTEQEIQASTPDFPGTSSESTPDTSTQAVLKKPKIVVTTRPEDPFTVDVRVLNQAAIDPENLYFLDWGDGEWPTGERCAIDCKQREGESPWVATHTYASPGSYTVSFGIKPNYSRPPETMTPSEWLADTRMLARAVVTIAP